MVSLTSCLKDVLSREQSYATVLLFGGYDIDARCVNMREPLQVDCRPKNNGESFCDSFT